MAKKNKKIRLILLKYTIRFIKNILVIPDGTCRFYPTCSKYAYDAVEKHTIYKAILLIIWRIIRCNPMIKGGYDPVK